MSDKSWEIEEFGPHRWEVSTVEGKYRFVYEDGKLSCLRYDEEWRDMTGDNAIASILHTLIEIAGQHDVCTAMCGAYGGESERPASLIAKAIVADDEVIKDELIQKASRAAVRLFESAIDDVLEAEESITMSEMLSKMSSLLSLAATTFAMKAHSETVDGYAATKGKLIDAMRALRVSLGVE